MTNEIKLKGKISEDVLCLYNHLVDAKNAHVKLEQMEQLFMCLDGKKFDDWIISVIYSPLRATYSITDIAATFDLSIERSVKYWDYFYVATLRGNFDVAPNGDDFIITPRRTKAENIVAIISNIEADVAFLKEHRADVGPQEMVAYEKNLKEYEATLSGLREIILHH